MKYFALDVETCGRDAQAHSLLEVSVIYDDLCVQDLIPRLPTFHCYIDKDQYQGEAGALRMHADIFRCIATKEPPYNYFDPRTAAAHLSSFFEKCLGVEFNYEKDRINVAGKNVMFDIMFLCQLPTVSMEGTKLRIGRDGHSIVAHARILDPAMVFANPRKDACLPSGNECMKRMGEEYVSKHCAYDDNLMTVKLLRSWANRTQFME
jgi:hypothetical protein